MNPEAATDAFIRKQSAPLQGTESAANAVARVSYTHDAMIDLLIANPAISQNAIAQHFGYSVAWVSRIRNSDAFLARLAERKADIVDPTIIATVEEKFRAVAAKSLDIVLEKLELAPSFSDALDAATLASKALGFGARERNLAVQQNFVVAMPGTAPNATTWAQRHGGSVQLPPGLAAMAEDAAIRAAEQPNPEA